MDRYGIASGTRIHETTIADRALQMAVTDTQCAIFTALHPIVMKQHVADRMLVESVRRLVRAGRDVERQRAFERGIAAFAAMPMFRMREAERNEFIGRGFWTGD